MWTNIYGEDGKTIPNSWAVFEEEISKEHEPVFKIELLNADMDPVGDTIRTACSCVSTPGRIDNVVSDGNIDVDVTRGTRRTAELTLLNPSAEFTPATEDFDPEGPWVGKVYLNRFVRTWRGVHNGRRHLYVPTGTFMIDTCEVIMEQNMSLVNLTLSDHWKKLTKSFYGNNKTYEKDTPYNEIIRDMLTSAGVPLTGKYGAVIDGMSDRATEDKRIRGQLKFNRGDSRGDKLKEQARRWGLDVYFDPMGVFRSEDRRDPRDKKEVWRFTSRETDLAGRNGKIVSLTRSFNDDNLYNHVIIIGTGNEKEVFKASRVDDNPRSKTNRDTIGDRVFLLESEKLSSQKEVNEALNRMWKKRFQLSETLTGEVVCNPALEGDDMVRFVEREKIKVDGRYRLQRFNVPMVTTRQTVEAMNIIHAEDL